MKEMYVALSGAVSREKQLALVANNLANVNSVGFKKDDMVFQVRPPGVDFVLLEKSASPELNLPTPRQRIEGDRNYVRATGSVTNFSTGELRPTERSLDMALVTKGPDRATPFFVVQTPAGERLTRAGDFALNESQEMATRDGYRVLSTAGQPIQVTGSPSEAVYVSPSGDISKGGQDIGSMRVVLAERPDRLVKTGNGLFSDPSGAAQVRDAQADDGVSVRQNLLEMANVNVVAELVKMIEIQRTYTALQKTIQTIDEASSRTITGALSA